jgi:TRAP transporter TAXI family solute receptor
MIPLALLLAMSLMAFGCPPPRVVDPVEPPEVPVDPLDEPLEEMFLSIGTGGVGGIYYVYGGGMAKVITEHVPELTATAEVTGASVANVRFIHAGEMELGFSMACVAWDAHHGTGAFKGEHLYSLRGLFYLYPSFHHWVTLAGSGIYSVADVVGRSISIGSPGSGTEVQATAVIEALGYTLADFDIHRLSFAENVVALRDGVIDVGVWTVGAGAASIIDIATTHDIRIIPFSPEELATIYEAHPIYPGGMLPAGTYRGVGDVPLPTVPNIIVVHEDLPYRVAYEILRAVFDNLDYLRVVHVAAHHTTLEAGPVTGIPLHPGAERFFRDRGVLD